MSDRSREDIFSQALDAAVSSTDTALGNLLPDLDDGPNRLAEAMRYAALGPGKRLRPFFTIETATLFNVVPEYAHRAAAAVECIHAYSLIHDDLPAMDNDDLRRGRPTAHKKFDEATAILAGDALLTLAFEIVSDVATHSDPHIRAELVHRLAHAAGWNGMVGGQMLDIQSETEELSEAAITRMQRMKTGALITVACDIGGLLGHASKEAHQALLGYAHDLGLAFQIKDDILDETASPDQMGKATAKDKAMGKATFVSILGLEGAKTRAQMLCEQAVQHLRRFDDRADALRGAASFVNNRMS